MPDLLVLGKTGQLARELARAGWPPGTRVACHGRDSADLGDAAAIRRLVEAAAPAVVINAAAYTAVDQAEREPDAADRVNRDGAAHVAVACAAAGIPLIHLSTDYVFDGEAAAAYREDAPTAPLSHYGQSKRAGEDAVRRLHAAHVILRTGGVFSPFADNLVRRVLQRAAANDALVGLADRWLCPTSAADLARAIATLAASMVAGRHAWGTYHFCGQPPTTVRAFIEEIVRLGAEAGLTAPRPVAAATTATWRETARRPRRAILDCTKIAATWDVAPRPWRDELAACIREIAAARPPERAA